MCHPLTEEVGLAVKRREWLECLSGKDEHSIFSQIYPMIWDAAAFRVVNEARLLAPKDRDGVVQLGGLLHALLNRSFFAAQMVAIRRLVDTYPLEGSKGVCSLRSLIVDLRKNATLFTRANVFAAEGLDYDYGSILQAEAEYATVRKAAGEKAWNQPDELSWEWNETRHLYLDRLCRVSAQKRSPSDVVCPGVFNRLELKVTGACKRVSDHVNKFIAHAATQESRADVQGERSSLVLNHLWEAHKAICQVANFVSVYILGDSSHNFLTHPLFDPLHYIERPLISPNQIEHLRGAWEAFESETQTWAHWDLDEYEKELDPPP